VRRLAVGALALAAANAHAATAYVSDELILGVYSEQNLEGERLATLHSGARVETLAANGAFTQVRLTDGTTGWVKTAYLTDREPATVRVKRLEEELDQSRATPSGLAEAAARSEVLRLEGELAAQQTQLAAALAARAPGAPRGTPAAHPRPTLTLQVAAGAVLAAAGCGFWLGYATLARRIKQKFGGLRVY
jgi:uncharacterized protein YgiM (DUF1202 family)